MKKRARIISASTEQHLEVLINDLFAVEGARWRLVIVYKNPTQGYSAWLEYEG